MLTREFDTARHMEANTAVVTIEFCQHNPTNGNLASLETI